MSPAALRQAAVVHLYSVARPVTALAPSSPPVPPPPLYLPTKPPSHQLTHLGDALITSTNTTIPSTNNANTFRRAPKSPENPHLCAATFRCARNFWMSKSVPERHQGTFFSQRVNFQRSAGMKFLILPIEVFLLKRSFQVQNYRTRNHG